MRLRAKAGLLLAVLTFSVLLWWNWKRDEPRRNSFRALNRLQASIGSLDQSALLDTVLLPPALGQRTSAEQTEFLVKTLRDEVSSAGVHALKKGAMFGSLSKVFPAEAAVWTQQAGVKVEDCVAFKMERDGLCAEVVLVAQNGHYRVVRCNNVKQMAGEGL